MDEKTLNELLECSVCLERLDSTSKVLPCQHTFCSRCLEEIVSSNTKNELRCPECRFLVENSKVSDLPSNLLLVRLLEGLKTSGAGTPAVRNKSQGLAGGSVSANYQSLAKKPGQATPCAKALYNYEAREPGDLSFKKGDLVVLRKQVDENWYHGELGGMHGFFPATYVQVITPLPQQELPKCKALFDFVIDDKNEKDCLTFQKDEVLTVIRRVDEHWVEGKHGDRIGIFPLSFVDLNDAAKWLITEQVAGFQPPSAPINHQQAPSSRGSGVVPPSPLSTDQSSSLLSSSATTSTDSALNIDSPSITTVTESTPAAPTVGILITTAGSVQSQIPTATMVSAIPACPTNIATISLHRNNTRPKRHSLTLVGHPPLSLCSTSTSYSSHRRSLELGNGHVIVTDPNFSRTASTVATADSASASGAIHEPFRSKPLAVHSSGVYKSMFNYKPQKEDELELIKGRYYLVSEKCQDGWFKGTCLAKGLVGVFPGNYVQLVRIAASSPSGDGPLVNHTQVACSSTMCSEARTNSILSRNHSFPKTSPYHLNSDMHHNHLATTTTSTTNVKVPSRTIITNVTQALNRSAALAGYPAQAHINHIGTTNTTPSHAEGRNTAETSQSTSTTTTTTTTTPVVVAAPVAGGSDKSHVCMNPGATNHSPKSSRRHSSHHHHHKHSSRYASIRTTAPVAPGVSAMGKDSVPVNGVCLPGGSSITVDTGVQEAGPSTSAQNTSVWVANNARANPEYAVTDVADKTHTKEKHRERRDRRSESLLKRLASAGIPLKGRKSRSPPPQLSTHKHHKHSTSRGSLYRSGSEGSLVEGAVACHSSSPQNHSHLRKPLEKLAKIKPLTREKYRCVTAYPAQGELELELRAGDTVYVHKKREDGWFKGTLHRNGKTGLFPSSFVAKV